MNNENQAARSAAMTSMAAGIARVTTRIQVVVAGGLNARYNKLGAGKQKILLIAFCVLFGGLIVAGLVFPCNLSTAAQTKPITFGTHIINNASQNLNNKINNHHYGKANQ